MFIDRFSESKIGKYEECPLKYLYKYVNRYQEDKGVKKHHLKFGSYIHRIFELGYGKETKDELLTVAEDIKNNFNFKQKIEDGKVEACVDNFLKFNSKLAETVGVELEYLIEIQKGITLNGIIDRIVKSPEGNYLIIDYKTSKRALTPVELYKNPQLQSYTYAVSRLFKVPYKKIMAAHFYPLTGKFIHCQYTPVQINNYIKKRVDQVWDIRKKKKGDFCPQQNQFCNWCEYQQICPEFNDPLVVKARLEERGTAEYRKTDSKPVTLLLDD